MVKQNVMALISFILITLTQVILQQIAIFPSTNVKIVKDGDSFAEYDSADTGGISTGVFFSLLSDGSITTLNEYNDDCENMFSEMSGEGKCEDATQ